jgi:hypothetical protein
MNENALPKTPRKRGGNGSVKAPIEDRFAVGHDFLLINHDIDDVLFSNVLGCVTEHKKNTKVVVLLITYGGSANVAYRVARFLQAIYEHIVVCVPSVCKSAGTLIAAGAHCIICMGFGEVGPLDVQLSRRDEIWGRRSGLTTRSALADLKSHSFDLFEHFMFTITAKSRGAVSFKLAAEIAGKVTAEMMSNIYAQINPESLGQDFMDLSVATKYCQNLDKNSKNMRPRAVQRLVYEYPSHDFVIDFDEAKELFHNVELPTATIISLLSRRMEVLQPRTGQSGVVEMLILDVEPAEKQSTQTPAEVNHDEQTKPIGGDGGGGPEAQA